MITAACRPFGAFAFLLVLVSSFAADAQTLILPQRNRTADRVIFYAAPNGNDANNDCLNVANPCTPQGAYTQSMLNWDFMNPRGGCFIKLAAGTPQNPVVYTVPKGQPLMVMAGAWVGHYGCQISGKVTPDFSTCIDPNSVVINIPNGGQGFYVKDGIIVIISCLTLTGANNAMGIWSQQSLVIDVGDVICGPIPRCIDASTTSAVNINKPFYFGGDMNSVFAAGALTQMKIWYQQIVALRLLNIAYLAQAYGAGANVEFLGSSIANPEAVTNTPQCIAAQTGLITYGGFNLPCSVIEAQGGHFYP
jgi:hypothetical protein